MFKSFLEYINEYGGSSAGHLEINKASVDEIVNYTINKCKEYNRDIFKEIPDFYKNVKFAKEKLKIGKTKRKDMPVISTAQTYDFQKLLVQGSFDIYAPYYKNTNPQKLFPEGLTKKEASEFIKRGLLDHNKNDDKIEVFEFKEPAYKLKPIQYQIYVDKSIDKIAKDGVNGCLNFLINRRLICSMDNFIIDGHHRLMTAMLINPHIKLSGIKINLDINKLKQLAIAYGDAIGNKRNK